MHDLTTVYFEGLNNRALFNKFIVILYLTQYFKNYQLPANDFLKEEKIKMFGERMSSM